MFCVCFLCLCLFSPVGIRWCAFLISWRRAVLFCFFLPFFVRFSLLPFFALVFARAPVFFLIYFCPLVYWGTKRTFLFFAALLGDPRHALNFLQCLRTFHFGHPYSSEAPPFGSPPVPSLSCPSRTVTQFDVAKLSSWIQSSSDCDQALKDVEANIPDLTLLPLPLRPPKDHCRFYLRVIRFF